MAPLSARTSGKGPRSAPRHPPQNAPRREAGPPPRRPARRVRRRGLAVTLFLYLMAEVLRIFALAGLAIGFLYIIVIAFQLVRDGIRLDFVWRHVLRTIAYPLFFSIPLAFLFGITLGIGRLANDHELSALRAQGISHRQLCAPILVLGLAFAGLTFYLTGWILPEVHYEQANLRKTILEQLNHLGSGTNRTILLPGEVSLWVKHYDGPSLRGIVLDIQNRSPILPEIGAIAGEAIRQRLTGQLAGKVTLVAREADLEVAPDRSRVILRLRGVELQMPEVVNGPRGLDVFHQTYSIEKLPLPLSFARRGESVKDLTNPDLLRSIGGLEDRARAIEGELRAARSPEAVLAIAGAGASSRADLEDGGPAAAMESLGRELAGLKRRLSGAESELHGRFAFSIACLTFPLVAFPLVILLERYGRLTHFFLGNLAVVTLFFPLVMVGNLAADRGLSPALAMALPNVALALLGIPLARAMFLR